jgi:hypothetical protein
VEEGGGWRSRKQQVEEASGWWRGVSVVLVASVHGDDVVATLCSAVPYRGCCCNVYSISTVERHLSLAPASGDEPALDLRDHVPYQCRGHDACDSG